MEEQPDTITLDIANIKSWTPTAIFRWKVFKHDATQRTLQQRWQSNDGCQEWRDIEVEEE